MIRLDKFLCDSGAGTRSQVKGLLKAGRVTVNGATETDGSRKLDPQTAEVTLDGKTLGGRQRAVVMMNKPQGYVTATEDRGPTVMDLLPEEMAHLDLKPVGRLDKATEGLLLFTNDGDVASQLTHPSLEKKKIYQVTLDKPLTRADMERIAEGVTLEDGEVYADEIAYASENKKEVGIEIHSGRNRIVRRIFEHLGYSVQKLDRVYYAGITKKNLKRGAWRFLTREEVERLKSGRYE